MAPPAASASAAHKAPTARPPYIADVVAFFPLPTSTSDGARKSATRFLVVG